MFSAGPTISPQRAGTAQQYNSHKRNVKAPKARKIDEEYGKESEKIPFAARQ